MAKSKATFKLNPKGCTQAVQQNTSVRQALVLTAQAIIDRTKPLIPVVTNRAHFAETLRFSPRWPEPTDTGAEIRVVSTSSFWHLIEWGSINNMPYRPLTRGAQSVPNIKWSPK